MNSAFFFLLLPASVSIPPKLLKCGKNCNFAEQCRVCLKMFFFGIFSSGGSRAGPGFERGTQSKENVDFSF